jgi:23S rRNA (cytosine1962-C5)-methyltransferase
METTVTLRPAREGFLASRHPWIFSGAVARVDGPALPGDVVRVVDHGGSFVGRGHWSPRSRIRVRLLSRDEGVAVDGEWWRRRLAEAVARRETLARDPGTDALRLVHGEADFLPGLVVDRYGDHLVLQALTAGTDRIKGALAGLLGELLRPEGIVGRGDAEVRSLEGLEPEVGMLLGAPPDGPVPFRENGHRFRADLLGGQKTGSYLDQRENRRLAALAAPGRDVLDCFSFTGAFSVHAAAGGARSLTLVDSSPPALASAREHLAENAPDCPAEFHQGNAFQVLRDFRDRGRSFDLVVMDPPKLAPTRASLKAASRAYKDLNLLALKLLRPGGILLTFSCSGAVDAAFFREILSWAASDAGREVQILRPLSQGEDHPVRLSFPESEYLKGLLCRVI